MPFALAFSLVSVEHWLAAGGYIVLFGLLFLCGLGLPLPEDIPLLAAGALSAAGRMDLLTAGIVAWAGIIGGDVVLYHIGRRFGPGVNKLPFFGQHFTAERMARVQRLYERYGVWVIAIGRLFAGIRGAVVVTAGVSKFNFWKFLIADGIAAVISGGFFLLLGRYLGTYLVERMDVIQRYKHLIFIVILVLVAIAVGVMIWRARRGRTPVPIPGRSATEPG